MQIQKSEGAAVIRLTIYRGLHWDPALHLETPTGYNNFPRNKVVKVMQDF